LALFLLPFFSITADEFKVDSVHSSVNFKVRHMMVGKVRGQFKEFDVKVWGNMADLTKAKVEAVIKVASIDTQNPKRDEHLRSEDFFFAEKYPEITFKSKSVEKKGDLYVLHGTLTMRGVSKKVSIPFEVLGEVKNPKGDVRVGIEGNTKLNRLDYGVKWNRTLDKGGVVVGNEVSVELLLSLVSSAKKTK
jgi:polyisoprenoid-binding protein YceI